jgi:hypothetical protein
MIEPEPSEPEVVDFVGVVLSKNDKEKYDVYRISVLDGALTLAEVKFGKDRLKKSAIKVMTLDLVGISQAITKGEIDFVIDHD